MIIMITITTIITIVITIILLRLLILLILLIIIILIYLVADKWGRHEWGHKVADFDRLGKKVRPWHFWEDKSRLTGVPKKSLCQKT